MNTVGIIGFGVLGKQIRNFLIEKNYQETVQIYTFDDYYIENDCCFKFNSFKESKFKDLEFYIGLGYKHLELKHEILEYLILRNSKTPSLIHNTAYISNTATIGKGAIIFPKCNIDQNVVIESLVTLHNSVIVSHDSSIGTGCYISPGVIISGNTAIGKNSFIGAGTIISNGIKVGNNVKIGIGSVVVNNLDNNVNVIGNPLKLISKELKIL